MITEHWSRARLATLTFYAACTVRVTILVLTGNSILFRFYVVSRSYSTVACSYALFTLHVYIHAHSANCFIYSSTYSKMWLLNSHSEHLFSGTTHSPLRHTSSLRASDSSFVPLSPMSGLRFKVTLRRPGIWLIWGVRNRRLSFHAALCLHKHWCCRTLRATQSKHFKKS